MKNVRQTCTRHRRRRSDRLASGRSAPARRLAGAHSRQSRAEDAQARQTGLGQRREAEFVEGDLRDRATMRAALEGVDVVFHQAAYGGYMPEIAKYVRREQPRHCADARDHPRREAADPESDRGLVAGRLQRRGRELPEARSRLSQRASGRATARVATGPCTVPSAAKSQPACRRRRKRRSAARPFTA